MSAHQKSSILIIDSDLETGSLTEGALQSNGYVVQRLETAEAALECAPNLRPDLILTELPENHSGHAEYVQALELWFPDAVVVAYTADADRRREPGHLFAHVRKPARLPELLAQVERALSFGRELAATRELSSMDRERFRNRLEWLLWKRTRESRRMIDYGVRMVANLRHSIAQGEGVGALLVQAEMLAMMAGAPGARSGNGNGDTRADPPATATLPVAALDSLGESARAVRAWLRSLEVFAGIDSSGYTGGYLTQAVVQDCYAEALASVERFRSVRGQQVHADPIVFDGSVVGNKEALGLAFREVLTNAFKYSPAHSSIHVVCFRGSDSVTIGVLNDLASGEQPDDWVNEAMLPFARFSNVYDDAFLDEELGLGIGLPVIMDALQQSGGTVFLRSITDHTRPSGKVERVMAELVLLTAADQLPTAGESTLVLEAAAPRGVGTEP